jgi:hypothetical protein
VWVCSYLAKRKSELKTVKKAVSLREDIYDDAIEFADNMFGGNFSAFISFAVVSFKKGLVTVVDSTHPRAGKVLEEIPKEEDIAEKTSFKGNFINDILSTMAKPKD